MSDGRQEHSKTDELSPVERLEELHRRNMGVFQAVVPRMFEMLRRHDPSGVSLNLDQDGVVNLVEEHSGASVYPGDPRVCCRQQVAQFRKDPSFIRATTTRTLNVIGHGPDHLSPLQDLLLDQPQEEPDGLPDEVDFMLVLGLGLGYHLEELLRETDIRHLCIIEPQLDLLLASTHTIEWLPLFQHFQRPGYSMNLILGKDREECSGELFGYLQQIGSFNAVVSFIYSHLQTEALNDSLNVFVQRVLPTLFESTGSFEDGRIGLAHTIENYRAGIPLLRTDPTPGREDLDRPAFIVGNGPSLDESIECLKEMQERVVIFSCGTAFGSLARAGIKSDFHVEQERVRSQAEWIAHASDAEDREGVTLLGLNVVHPEVFGLFERVGMGLKFNDAGTAFLQQHHALGGSEVQLTESNPTVANAALSFVKAMGFREVYLVGVDLGFPEGDKHHSKLSLYYDLKEGEEQTLEFPRRPSENALRVPGNLVPEVVTSSLFLRTKEALEAGLAKSPHIRCFNTSAGVLIRGAQPIRISDVRLESGTFDKVRECSDRFDRFFGTEGLTPLRDEQVDALRKGLLDALSQMESIVESPACTRREAMGSLASLHEALRSVLMDEATFAGGMLLKGGISLYSMMLALALFRLNREEDSVALYNQCREHFLTFLRTTPVVVRESLVEPDQALDDLAQRLTTVA